MWEVFSAFVDCHGDFCIFYLIMLLCTNYLTHHLWLTPKPLQTKAHLDGVQVKMSTDVLCHVILKEKKDRTLPPIISYCLKPYEAIKGQTFVLKVKRNKGVRLWKDELGWRWGLEGERKKINYILSWEHLLLYPRTQQLLIKILGYYEFLIISLLCHCLKLSRSSSSLTYNDVDIKWQVAFKSLENIKNLGKWFFIVDEEIPILWELKGWLYWLRITTNLEHLFHG